MVYARGFFRFWHIQLIFESTHKHSQWKASAFVSAMNRGSSPKLHSLLTPSGPVHPQHVQQSMQTHTNSTITLKYNKHNGSCSTHFQPHSFTVAHFHKTSVHANTHRLTEGCMCWSLVVCSRVFSVVDATRHTKATWVKKCFKKRTKQCVIMGLNLLNIF